jgi:hypothetical protein
MKRRRSTAVLTATILAALTLAPGNAATAEPVQRLPVNEGNISLPPVYWLIDPPPIRCIGPTGPQRPRRPWRLNERRRIGLSVVGFGALSAAAGAGTLWWADEIRRRTPSQIQSAGTNHAIYERSTAASILFGVGALAMVTGAVIVLWPEGANVTVTPNGQALVGYRGAF